MSNKIKINVFQEMDDQQKLYQNSSNPIDNYIKSENLDSLKRGPSNSETININPENETKNKPKINLEIPKDDSLLISTLENKNNSSSLLLFGLGLLGLLIISSSLNEKKSKSDSQDKKD